MWAFGHFKLSYKEFNSVSLHELNFMIKGAIEYEGYLQDNTLQIVAWQTSMLMNATGNYKKPIKPSDLYVPANQSSAKKTEKEKAVDIEVKRQELLNTFGL